MKKIVSCMMLVLILISTLTVAFNIKPAKTEPTTIIVPDNYPTIQTAINMANNGDTIFVRSGVYNENIIIRKAISLIGESVYNTIINGSLSGNVVKIRANGVTIKGFTIMNSGWIDDFTSGLYLEESHNCNIIECNITNNHHGIYLRDSNSNNFINNHIVANNWYGVWLRWSSHNTFVYNTFAYNNFVHIYIWDYSGHNNFTSNNILNLLDIGFEGLLIGGGSSDNMIKKNTFINCGICVGESYRNFVIDNVVNGKPLVYLEDSSNIRVEDAGQVILVRCTNMIIENLNIWNASIGIELLETNYTQVIRNNIKYNFVGIIIVSSFHNTIAGNNIADNLHGLSIANSNHNVFYHNKFVNKRQIVCGDDVSYNIWDGGYPFGGNFWSDYSGNDVFKGPNQNITGRDGIGDTPYNINAFNVDRYPLITPNDQVDTNPPTTSNNYDGLWHTSDFIITLNALDDLSGVAETYYKINNGQVMSITTNGQPLFTVEGSDNTLEYWSVDNVQNEEQHNILTGIKLDKTPPSILIENPFDGAVLFTSTVTFNISANDLISGVSRVELYVDGQLKGDMSYDGTQYTLTVPSITKGSHNWYAKAYDNAGRTATTSIATFTIQITEALIGNLSIYVKNLNGDPIVGANVSSTVQPSNQQTLSGITNSEGYVAFNNITPGSYTFEISKQGYQTIQKEVKVYPNQETIVTVNLPMLEIQEKPPDFKPLYYVGGAIGLIAIITVAYLLTRRKHPQPPSVTITQSSEVQRYRQFLEKLEEKYRAGEISEDVYQKLKREYLEKLRGYEG